MQRHNYSKFALILLILTFLLGLVVTPLYSQGEGKGKDKDKDKGQGNHQEHNPPGQGNPQDRDHNPPGQENKDQNNNASDEAQDQPVVEQNAQTVPQQEDVLGCQKNNPDRLDCSSLEVSGYCDGTTAVFIIRNTGEPGNGDMRAATSYQILQNGSVVQSGSVQLGGGQSMTITYEGGGEITLLADQQVGHPGSSHPRVTLNCGSPEEPTEEPTPTEEVTPEETPTEEVTPEVTPTEEVTPEVTPTEEVTPEVTPTEEVTPEVTPPDLYAGDDCYFDGTTAFYIGNAGGAMTEPVNYTVTDNNGNVVADGSIQLQAGEFFELEVGIYYGEVTLNIGDGLIIVTAECFMPTEEVFPPELEISAYCDANNGVVFEIFNAGSTMTEPLYYIVMDMFGNLITDGWIQLAGGDTMTLNVGPQDGVVALEIGMFVAYKEQECVMSTEEPTPTEEVTPEVTPTEEVTPEVTPTEEVTPEVTPTEEVTPEVTPTEEVTPEVTPEAPNCSKHNRDRLDCSSLQVSAYCDGNIAVFVIRNTGNAGEGDMVTGTEYRLIQNGVVIESGTIQIMGGDTLEIRYEGSGRITLEADQQIGHPGKSQPQATINCGG